MRTTKLAMVLLLCACAGVRFQPQVTAAPTTSPPPAAGLKKPAVLFSRDSFWNQPLARDLTLDPRSEAMRRALLLEMEHGHGFARAVEEWTIPVYLADAATPRYDVPLLAPWVADLRLALRQVPVPPHARPDPARDDGGGIGDAHLCIIDTNSGVAYDLWQARRKNGRWVASWGNRIRLDGSGIYPCGMSARASGTPLLAGLIWPEELRRGKIDRKLAFRFPYNHARGPVPPLTASDGTMTEEEMRRIYRQKTGRREDVFPIPQGAVVQLDPAVNLATVQVSDPETGARRLLKRHEQVIARAMQEYGMVDVDNGGAIALYAVHPQSYGRNPYQDLLPDGSHVMLPRELIARTRVLCLGPLRNNPATAAACWEHFTCFGQPCRTPTDKSPRPQIPQPR